MKRKKIAMLLALAMTFTQSVGVAGTEVVFAEEAVIETAAVDEEAAETAVEPEEQASEVEATADEQPGGGLKR